VAAPAHKEIAMSSIILMSPDAVAATMQLKGNAAIHAGRILTPESMAAQLINIAIKAQPQFSAAEFDSVMEVFAHAVTASMVLHAAQGHGPADVVESFGRTIVDTVSDGVKAGD
jgi:hypothetical protein